MSKKNKKLSFFDLLTPRFLTEDVAVIWVDGDKYNLQPICAVSELEDSDRKGTDYDEIITIRSFNFFGLGLFPSFIRGESDSTNRT